jgi:hypothetical protein
LKPRSETAVKLSTKLREFEIGLREKIQMTSKVIIVGTLTVMQQGACLTSVVNMNDKEVEISLPTVTLESCEKETVQVGIILAQGEAATEQTSRTESKNKNRPPKCQGMEIHVKNL